MKTCLKLLCVSLVLGLLAIAAPAADFTFAVDIPATLGAATFLPYQLAIYHAGAYASGPDLPGLALGTQIDALDLYADGDPVFSTDAPFTVGSTTYLPGDVVRYDTTGGTYSLVFSSISNLGLSASSNIDALSITAAGFIASFDAPVTAGSATYLPNDLVAVTGSPGAYGLSLLWSGSGLPPGSNICGLDVYSATRFAANFDAPVTLDATTYQPGQILQYSGGTWSAVAFSPALPSGTVMADFYFNSPGEVPLATGVPGAPLMVAKSTTGGVNDLDLTWGASCLGTVTDYAIYEGLVGSYYSHATQSRCTTGDSTSATITPTGDNHYYLVVPTNGPVEGGYGRDSAGAAIPRSTNPCQPGQRITPCP